MDEHTKWEPICLTTGGSCPTAYSVFFVSSVILISNVLSVLHLPNISTNTWIREVTVALSPFKTATMRWNNISMAATLLLLNLYGGSFNSNFMVRDLSQFFDPALIFSIWRSVTERYSSPNPSSQCIIFDPSLNARHIVECGENSDTPLLAFFKANQYPGPIGNLAQSLIYQEFPEQFMLKFIQGELHSKT